MAEINVANRTLFHGDNLDFLTVLAKAQEIEGLVACAGCGRKLEVEFMELDHRFRLLVEYGLWFRLLVEYGLSRRRHGIPQKQTEPCSSGEPLASRPGSARLPRVT